jgi:hypothetical protein
MAQFITNNIRNVCLLGHSGSGKTATIESMLFRAKATARLGRVCDGNTVSDYDSEEIKRGISIGLSTIRIIYGFSLLYYLIPGYLLSLGLSFFVPGLYTAIAFDSGGVASGPLTSTFILPMMIGVCYILQGEAAVLCYAFGMIAMVAMTPLITIQILGFRAVVSARVRERIVMKRILDADDEQIIYFE